MKKLCFWAILFLVVTCLTQISFADNLCKCSNKCKCESICKCSSEKKCNDCTK